MILPADDEGHGFLTTVGGDERVKMSLVGFDVVGDLHGRAVAPENGEWKKGRKVVFRCEVTTGAMRRDDDHDVKGAAPAAGARRYGLYNAEDAEGSAGKRREVIE